MTREDLIGSVSNDQERQQYDGADGLRIGAVTQALTQVVVDLIGTLGQYEEVVKDEEEDGGYARRMMIEQWGMAQAAVSKVAWALRIDGDDAYSRVIGFLDDEEMPLDMSGL